MKKKEFNNFSDINAYILILDKNIEYETHDEPYHLLFHSSTIENKITEDMNEHFDTNVIDTLKELFILNKEYSKKNISKIRKNILLDKIFEIEEKFKMNVFFIEESDNKDIQIIDDIKYESHPHLIWIEDCINGNFDYWKIGGFYDTVGTILRHCSDYYDDVFNDEENMKTCNYQRAYNIVDMVEDEEEKHIYTYFTDKEDFNRIGKSINVQIWLLENHI